MNPDPVVRPVCPRLVFRSGDVRPGDFIVDAVLQGEVVGWIEVVRQGLRELEIRDRAASEWVLTRGSDWSVVGIEVRANLRRCGAGTQLYEAAANGVRARGGAFLSSDTIRSEMAEGFWRKQVEKRRTERYDPVQFTGGGYVMLLKFMPRELDLSGLPRDQVFR